MGLPLNIKEPFLQFLPKSEVPGGSRLFLNHTPRWVKFSKQQILTLPGCIKLGCIFSDLHFYSEVIDRAPQSDQFSLHVWLCDSNQPSCFLETGPDLWLLFFAAGLQAASICHSDGREVMGGMSRRFDDFLLLLILLDVFKE